MHLYAHCMQQQNLAVKHKRSCVGLKATESPVCIRRLFFLEFLFKQRHSLLLLS